MDKTYILVCSSRDMNQRKMKVLGEEKSFVEVMAGFAGIDKAIEKNKYQYRRTWEQYVPPIDGNGNEEGYVAYRPVTCMRQVFDRESNLPVEDAPYFVLIENLGRDEREHTNKQKRSNKKLKKRKESETKEEHEESCPVCRNLINKNMILTEFDDFYLTPNGFPYHEFSSLLVDMDYSKKQDNPTSKDIETWMKFSILTKQTVFYNTFGAGATIEHQHAQVVDPGEIVSDNKILPYPILHPSVQRQRLDSGMERLINYPVDAVTYSGREAPSRAHGLCQRIAEKGGKYNLIINGREIMVIGRVPKNEKSHCIGKNVGAYEIMGIFLLGNIEEPILGTSPDTKIVEGTDLFKRLAYPRLAENIEYSIMNLDGFIEPQAGKIYTSRQT